MGTRPLTTLAPVLPVPESHLPRGTCSGRDRDRDRAAFSPGWHPVGAQSAFSKFKVLNNYLFSKELNTQSKPLTFLLFSEVLKLTPRTFRLDPGPERPARPRASVTA